jgi:hypothetical protein
MRPPVGCEGRAGSEGAYKVATQMGNQGFSHEGTKTACEIVWSGEIGDVREVHAWTGAVTGGRLGVPEAGLPRQPVRDTFDRDLRQEPAAAMRTGAAVFGLRRGSVSSC